MSAFLTHEPLFTFACFVSTDCTRAEVQVLYIGSSGHNSLCNKIHHLKFSQTMMNGWVHNELWKSPFNKVRVVRVKKYSIEGLKLIVKYRTKTTKAYSFKLTFWH
jgi:hypothetical protein